MAKQTVLKATVNCSIHAISRKHEARVPRMLYNFPKNEDLPINRYKYLKTRVMASFALNSDAILAHILTLALSLLIMCINIKRSLQKDILVSHCCSNALARIRTDRSLANSRLKLRCCVRISPPEHKNNVN